MDPMDKLVRDARICVRALLTLTVLGIIGSFVVAVMAGISHGQVPPDVAAAVAAATTLPEAKLPTPAPLPIPAPPPSKPLWRNPLHRAATLWGSKTCAPCQVMKPDIEALQKEGWEIEYQDTGANAGAAQTWNVEQVPLLVIHDHAERGRQEVGRHIGFADLGRLRATLKALAVHRDESTVPLPGDAPVPAATPGTARTAGPALLQSGGCAGGSCGTRSGRSR